MHVEGNGVLLLFKYEYYIMIRKKVGGLTFAFIKNQNFEESCYPSRSECFLASTMHGRGMSLGCRAEALGGKTCECVVGHILMRFRTLMVDDTHHRYTI